MAQPTGFESYDPRFDALLRPGEALERLHTGTVWAEGPVWFSEGSYLLWSDIPRDRMLRWSAADGVTVFRQPCHYTNGHTRDLQGRLVSCEHGARRVSRTEPDGTITTLADRYRGKRLNSPNDVVVKRDGTVWFTDPPYGILSDHEGHKADQEQPGCYVYRLDPESGELTAVATDRDRPNGLAFNLDESLLYVSDTARNPDNPDGWHHIFVYEVLEGRKLGPGREFAAIEPGASDGFRFDANGFLFTSSGDGVQVFDAEGKLLGRVFVPETAANCTFGGAERDRLFITATSSLYAVRLNTRGVQAP